MRFAFFALLSACGAIDIGPDASNATADAASDVGATDASGCFVCPATLPPQGGACTSTTDAAEGCEYGDFTTGDCSQVATCTDDAGWNVETPPSPQCMNGPSCPSAFDDPAPSCTLGLRCDYARGRCACEETTDGGGLVWTCKGAGSSSCPPSRPRIGSSCTGTEECVYGEPNGCSDLVGVVVECDPCGTWQRVPIVIPPCPH